MIVVPTKQQGPIEISVSPGLTYLSTTFVGTTVAVATVPPGETWVVSSITCLAQSGAVYLPDRCISLTWRRLTRLLMLISGESFGRNVFAYLTAGAGAGDSDVFTPGQLVTARGLPTVVAVNGDTLTAAIVPGNSNDSIRMTLNYQVIR
jgi:hypothetical protein